MTSYLGITIHTQATLTRFWGSHDILKPETPSVIASHWEMLEI